MLITVERRAHSKRTGDQINAFKIRKWLSRLSRIGTKIEDKDCKSFREVQEGILFLCVPAMISQRRQSVAK
jgi:hypothetical protein